MTHVARWDGCDAQKAFTAASDPSSTLVAPGRPPIEARAGRGGTTSGDGRVRYARLRITGDAGLDPCIEYAVVPRNGEPRHPWVVDGTLPPLVARPSATGR